MIVLPSERSQYHTSKVDKDFITAMKASLLTTKKSKSLSLSIYKKSSCAKLFTKMTNAQVIFINRIGIYKLMLLHKLQSTYKTTESEKQNKRRVV